MKKLLLVISLCLLVGGARADCVSETVYVACKPGYYLYADDCKRCPSSGGVYGTTPDQNTGDITSCYIPAGEISWTDDSGTYVCTENSYYEN